MLDTIMLYACYAYEFLIEWWEYILAVFLIFHVRLFKDFIEFARDFFNKVPAGWYGVGYALIFIVILMPLYLVFKPFWVLFKWIVDEWIIGTIKNIKNSASKGIVYIILAFFAILFLIKFAENNFSLSKTFSKEVIQETKERIK